MDKSPPGSSVHGILQARILEWFAMPCSRGTSQPRSLLWPLHCRQILYHWATGEAQGLITQAQLVKSLAIGDRTQSPAPPPSPEVWGWAQSFDPLITWLTPLTISPLPLLKPGFPKVPSLTYKRHLYCSLHQGNSKCFSNSLPEKRRKTKYMLSLYITRVQSLCWEDPLEKRMATHSS